MNASAAPTTPFMTAYRGRLVGMLQWQDLDRLWERVRATAGNGWYVYAVGEPPPTLAAAPPQVERFVTEINALLRREHDESYCGIVYADDRDQPRFIKIYDPNHLGASCGSSGEHIFPGWILTQHPPQDLKVAMAPPSNRRRWWQRLFGN